MNNSVKINKEINFYKTSSFLINNRYISDLKNKLDDYNQKTNNLVFNISIDENVDLDKKTITTSFKFIFDTYQDVISHYCRNVYHILKYIRENEKNKTLGEDFNKYKSYANIFQSQLNVDEQFLLFYNFIHFNKETKDEMFWTINLVNHYQFLENIGIDNLIFKKHEEFYDFVIKGSDRKIEKN